MHLIHTVVFITFIARAFPLGARSVTCLLGNGLHGVKVGIASLTLGLVLAAIRSLRDTYSAHVLGQGRTILEEEFVIISASIGTGSDADKSVEI